MKINSVPDVKCFCNNKKRVTCTINGMTFCAPPCMYVCIVFDMNTRGLTRWLYHNTQDDGEDNRE